MQIGEEKPFKPGEGRKRFAQYFLAQTGRELTDKEIERVFGTDANGFSLLFDILAKDQNLTFTDLTDFIIGVNILKRDWGGQKLFYEKPEASGTPDYANVTGQSKDTSVRLYSARKQEHVQRLIWWALQNKIDVEGLKGDPDFTDKAPKEPVTAPFGGHLADRLHTVQHLGQKGKGARVISIVLTAKGSTDLRKAKSTGRIAKKGEGDVVGAFGLKSELSYVSVALGESRQTWDFLKPRIAKITLEGSHRAASNDSSKGKGEEGPPSWLARVGRLENVDGEGMNCLIRAFLRATGNADDDYTVGELREVLVAAQVAEEGEMLDLADEAGAVLISTLVAWSLLDAGRGVDVYTPESGPEAPRHVVAGSDPVRLWLSNDHFQAILP